MFFYRDGNIYYCLATIIFTVLPFYLIMIIGDGWQTLKEAAAASDNLKGQTLRVIVTLFSFTPGFSWLPPATRPFKTYKLYFFKHGRMSELFGQNVHVNKMYEMYGENAPQFILQLSIILKQNPVYSTQELLVRIFTEPQIVTSLISLLKRSASIYLELETRNKDGQRRNQYATPFTNWKNTVIVGFMMVLTVPPRILTLALYFGSSFPLLVTDSTLVLGIRFGLAIFLSSIIIYTAIFCIAGYFKVIKTGQIFWSELVLSAFSALIGPCRIFQRKSKMLFLSSFLSVFNHILLMGALLITLHVKSSIWNEALSERSVEFFKTQSYVLLCWNCLSLIASWFLEKYSDLEFRYSLSNSLCCDEEEDFLFACSHGLMELVQKLLLSGNTKILNKVDQDGDGALHTACADQTFDVVNYLVDQMEEKHMNINVRNIYGDNALVYAIENLEIMQLLVQTGKLDIKRNNCVSNYVNLWGSISFVCNTDDSNTGKFIVKMDSFTVVNSIQKFNE